MSEYSKAFGTDVILKNASFHIEDREKAAIVGINGAGKSTLLKIIMHQLDPDSGDVILAKEKPSAIWPSMMLFLLKTPSMTSYFPVKAELLAMEKRIRELELEMKSLSGEALKAYWKPITGSILSLSVRTVMPSKANSPAF